MSTVLHVSHCSTPIGLLAIQGDEQYVRAVTFVDVPVDGGAMAGAANAVTAEAAAQLDAYFRGARRTFELPLAPQGTTFQRAVWAQLLQVPFGETASYRDIALALGNDNGVRAVGAANGRNPIAVIIPCHRIIGSNGQLTGYGGGLWRKEWLLRHEGALLL